MQPRRPGQRPSEGSQLAHRVAVLARATGFKHLPVRISDAVIKVDRGAHGWLAACDPVFCVEL